MTVITCKKCKKDFNHFRFSFPKGYVVTCSWCGQEHHIEEDCHSPKLKIGEIKT